MRGDEAHGGDGAILDEVVETRLEADVASALRRRPANEARLAGSLRCLAPYSRRLTDAVERACRTLAQRAAFGRALYISSIRALAETDGRRAAEVLGKVLASEEAGGLASLSAAGWTSDPSLAQPLARVAISRHPHLAFAAEVARIARGESGGDHVASVAPMIKESHRISLCAEVFVPLLWRPALPLAIAPALAVLRSSERHLGRWLVFAEAAVRAGDRGPLEEAKDRAADGPKGARSAWALVAWALAGGGAPPPAVRPTVELVSRLSDRPSAERDPTFLFRLAAAGAPLARPMLEGLAKGPVLDDATAVRSALYLVRDHGRTELRKPLVSAAGSARRELLRGVATAALHDIGDVEVADAAAGKLLGSKQVATVTWAALVRAAAAGRLAPRRLAGDAGAGAVPRGALLTEPHHRRIQLGWAE
jgi:hypothetical protein